MQTKIFVYFLAHGLLWLGAFWAYRWWVDRPGGYRWKSVVGLGMAYGCILTQVVPCLGLSGLAETVPDLDPQKIVGLCFLLLAGVLGLVGVICFSSRLKSHRTMGSCPTERDPLTPHETLRTFRLAKENLASIQRSFEGREVRTVPLCLTETVALPLLVGLNPPRIYVPIRFAMRPKELEPIVDHLARWARYRRYRSCMLLCWISQFHLLLLPLASGIRKALERELVSEAGDDLERGRTFHDAMETFELPAASSIPMGLVPLRMEDSHCPPRHTRPWGFLPAMGLVALCCCGAWQTGTFNLHDLAAVMSTHEIVGYSLHAYDPGVKFMARAGTGGLLPDGLIVDTRSDGGHSGCSTVRFPLGLIESERLVPFDAEALNIHLEWKTHERSSAFPDPPALKIECSEQTRIDGDGQQQLLTFYRRTLLIPEDSIAHGQFDLPIRLHPAKRAFNNSTDVVYGPVLFVPRGWVIEFGNYSIQKLQVDEVPVVPPGEVVRFLAWYRRNGGRPALPDLRWEEESHP